MKSSDRQSDSMNVVLNFHHGDQRSAKLFLELLLKADEGIDCSYYLQYGDDVHTLRISETLLEFISKKGASFSTELPHIVIPKEMLENDPNLLTYSGNHTRRSEIQKMKHLQWNLCVYKYIQSLDNFLMVEPDSVVLKHGWLRDIYEGWQQSPDPVFGHLKRGKILGGLVPTHWAGSSVYSSRVLRGLNLEKYFYERFDNPWWEFRNEPDTTTANNCFWGPKFSGYDVSYDYFLFALYWREKTGRNDPLLWPLSGIPDRHDLILCDFNSTMSVEEIMNRYAGRLPLLHGVKHDGIRETMLEYFSSNPPVGGAGRKVGESSSVQTAGSVQHIVGTSKREKKQTETARVTEKQKGPENIAQPPTGMDTDLSKYKDIHRFKRLFIMGNGPSLNKMDLNKLEGEYVFCSNAIFLLFPRIKWRPAFYTCVDTRVLPDRASDILKMHEGNPELICFFPKSITDHQTRVVTPTETIIPPGRNRVYFEQKPLLIDSQPWLDELPYSAFSTDANKFLLQPFTVSITMLQLAVYMGFEPIYLVGCDTDYKVPKTVIQAGEDTKQGKMFYTSTVDDDPNHFSTDYFGKGRKWHNPQVENMIWHYKMAHEVVGILGRHVYNATVGGKLEVFPRINFDELF